MKIDLFSRSSEERRRTQIAIPTAPPPVFESSLDAQAEIDRVRELQEETIHHLEEEVDTSGQIPIPKRKPDSAKVNDDATTIFNADGEEAFLTFLAESVSEVPTILDEDDEAAYLAHLADMEDLRGGKTSPEVEEEEEVTMAPRAPKEANETAAPEEHFYKADLEDIKIYDAVPSESTTEVDYEGLDTRSDDTPTLSSVEDGATATEATAPSLLDSDDENSFLLFLADFKDKVDTAAETAATIPEVEDEGEEEVAMAPRGPKEVEEDFLEDFEEFPSKEVREKATGQQQTHHGEDMAIMDMAGTDATPVQGPSIDDVCTDRRGGLAKNETE